MVLLGTKKFIAVGCSTADETWLQAAVGKDGVGDSAVIEAVADADQALRRIAETGCDLIIFDLDGHGCEGSIASLRLLRDALPRVPLVVIGSICDESTVVEVLRAGVEEYLSKLDTDGGAFARGIRNAVERSQYHLMLDEKRDRAAHDLEMGGLSALCGPPPLPVTERSFGIRALTDRAPEDFDKMVRRYTELLTLSLKQREVKIETAFTQDLSALADQLGMLGAGPRDVVDLHKAAIAAGLEGQVGRRARAYVEEGRLSLLQLMGYLVSYYRNLSWGQSTSSLARSNRLEALGSAWPAKGKGSE